MPKLTRIEEVKKILDKYRGAFICDNKCQDRTNETIAQELCQLFPQPLEDKELDKAIDEILAGLHGVETSFNPECVVNYLTSAEKITMKNKILALLQEAKGKMFNKDELQHLMEALKVSYKDEWCSVCEDILGKLQALKGGE